MMHNWFVQYWVDDRDMDDPTVVFACSVCGARTVGVEGHPPDTGFSCDGIMVGSVIES